jgi:sigma-B regulation protein RsbU (phosphoserine phosphatase)
MSAALFRAVSRTVLRAVAPTVPGPGACLERVNDLLAADNEAGMFVTLFYGIYDTRDGRLLYANGGHNPPLLRTAAGTVAPLAGTDGTALAMFDGLAYAEAESRLAPGDLLLLYTDGVTEAHDPANTLFGEPRLEATFAAVAGGDPDAVVQATATAVEAFAATAPQADDLTVMVMRVSALGSD